MMNGVKIVFKASCYVGVELPQKFNFRKNRGC